MSTPPPESNRPNYESTPVDRSEYITAIVHLYRGELFRANSWRMRLDQTTNWSIITAGGLLTFSFQGSSHSHWVLLVGLALICVFHAFEARRFRISDVFRRRVRMLEANFYAPILRRDPRSPEESWGFLVAEDLTLPRFKIGKLEALRNRLTRSYWAVYILLISAWVVLIVAGGPEPCETIADVKVRLATGIIPWWVPVSYVGTFVSALIALMIATKNPPNAESEYWRVDDPVPLKASRHDL